MVEFFQYLFVPGAETGGGRRWRRFRGGAGQFIGGVGGRAVTVFVDRFRSSLVFFFQPAGRTDVHSGEDGR